MTTPNVGPVFGAIQVEHISQIQSSVEVVRMWVQHEGPGTFVINPDRLEDPEMFGMMMTDCVRHAARAFAIALNITEGEALDRIWCGLDAERDDFTTDINTVQENGGAAN
jgi:hypothetical protein